MIQEFILSVLLLVVLLFTPGFFLLKSFKVSNIRAVCFSPLVAIFLYSLMGILLDKLQIPTTGVLLSLPVIILSVAVFCASSVVGILKKRSMARSESAVSEQGSDDSFGTGSQKRLWLIAAGYCVVGVVLYYVIYLSALPLLSNVPEDYDNIFHFNLLRSFIDSGSWSLLNSSIYLDTAGAYPAPFSAEGVYYPAAWHILCALPVSIIGIDVGIAANALNLVLIAFVFALAMFVFLSILFEGDRTKLAFGAVVVFAFGALPWVLLTFWPLYPNLISMTLVPLVCAAFLIATGQNISLKRRMGYALLTIIGIGAQAICQPNSIFVDALILAPYVVYAASKAFLSQREKHTSKFGHPQWAWGIGFLVALAILLVWFVLTQAPFMQRVVGFYTAPLMSFGQAIASSISLSLAINSPQYALGLLVIAGALYILVRERRLIWLLVSYLIALIFFVVAASFGDVWIKHFLTGFWYTDPYRVASIVPVVGVPIAALGLYAICAFIISLIKRIAPSVTKAKKAIYCLLPLLFALAIYVPGVVGSVDSNAFKFLRFASTDAVTAENRVAFSDEEKDFVEQVKQVIEDDAVVLNNPFDGSMVAYGISGLPVYNRSRTNYGTASESPESALFREHLNELSTNVEVQNAIDTVGAGYVLSLGKSANRMRVLFYHYDRDAWSGFTQISDETPGLELVLSDGDMKLYKIAI